MEQSKSTMAKRRGILVPKISVTTANNAARPKAEKAPEGDGTRNPTNMTTAAATITACSEAGCMAFIPAS